MTRQLSDALFRNPRWFLMLLLAPPLLWLGIVFLGSLLALLLHSFYSIDEFSGFIRYEFTLSTYAELLRLSNLDVIIRSLIMALAVTFASIALAFPFAYFAARYARGKWKALFYLLVMLPLWSSYLVKVYAWKLILAKEGIVSWLAGELHLTWLLDALLSIPVIGGPSLSFSFIGTFLVFVYVWLPYMILPTQAALERVPANLLEASADLGATPIRTFLQVTLPLALPGVAMGSMLVFILLMGDYILPQYLGGGKVFFVGNALVDLFLQSRNWPFGAAVAVARVVVMLITVTIYMRVIKRWGNGRDDVSLM